MTITTDPDVIQDNSKAGLIGVDIKRRMADDLSPKVGLGDGVDSATPGKAQLEIGTGWEIRRGRAPVIRCTGDLCGVR